MAVEPRKRFLPLYFMPPFFSMAWWFVSWKVSEAAYTGLQSNKPPCNAFQDGSICINSITKNTPFC